METPWRVSSNGSSGSASTRFVDGCGTKRRPAAVRIFRPPGKLNGTRGAGLPHWTASSRGGAEPRRGPRKGAAPRRRRCRPQSFCIFRGVDGEERCAASDSSIPKAVLRGSAHLRELRAPNPRATRPECSRPRRETPTGHSVPSPYSPRFSRRSVRRPAHPCTRPRTHPHPCAYPRSRASIRESVAVASSSFGVSITFATRASRSSVMIRRNGPSPSEPSAISS